VAGALQSPKDITVNCHNPFPIENDVSPCVQVKFLPANHF